MVMFAIFMHQSYMSVGRREKYNIRKRRRKHMPGEVHIIDLQLKPYRTEEFVHKLYYESSRFSAFGHQWVVKAFINKHQRDPTQSSQRELTYQLIVKSKAVPALALQWVVLRGPYGEARLEARVGSHLYREDAAEGPPLALPLADRADTNRLLANKAIHFRLIMFQSSKS